MSFKVDQIFHCSHYWGIHSYIDIWYIIVRKLWGKKSNLRTEEKAILIIIVWRKKTRNWGQIGQSDIGKTSTLKPHVSLKNMQHTWHKNDFKLTRSQTLMYRFSQINYFPRLDLTLSRLCILRAIGWDLSSGITLKSLNFYCHTIKGNWCFTREFRASR